MTQIEVYNQINGNDIFVALDKMRGLVNRKLNSNRINVRVWNRIFDTHLEINNIVVTQVKFPIEMDLIGYRRHS